MKSPKVLLSALVATALLSVSSAFAQTPAAVVAPKAATAAATPAAKAEKKAAAKPAKSKECSAKADEQKLHGKARQKFREEC